MVNFRAPVRTLKTSEAAAALNVSPNTLRAWERRFAYPKPQRTAGQHRLYTDRDIFALRDALQQGLSISSAVARAREAISEDTTVLGGALAAFDVERADAAMEAALALRSVERAIEEVLLSSLGDMADRHGADSAPWAFAARWATDWLEPRPAPRAAALAVGRRAHRGRDARRPRPRRHRAAGAAALHGPRRRTGPRPARSAGSPASATCSTRSARRPSCSPAAAPGTTTSPGGPTASGPPRGRCPSRIFRRGELADGGRTATRVLPSSPTEAHEELLAMLEHRSVHPPTQLLDEDDLAELLGRAERRHGIGA